MNRQNSVHLGTLFSNFYPNRLPSLDSFLIWAAIRLKMVLARASCLPLPFRSTFQELTLCQPACRHPHLDFTLLKATFQTLADFQTTP